MQVIDLIFQVLNSEQWAELLKGPLEHAASEGNGGLAQKLVEAGAQIGDALHAALRGGHAAVVEDLLDHGASVNAKQSSGGCSPLQVAAAIGGDRRWLSC